MLKTKRVETLKEFKDSLIHKCLGDCENCIVVLAKNVRKIKIGDTFICDHCNTKYEYFEIKTTLWTPNDKTKKPNYREIPLYRKVEK